MMAVVGVSAVAVAAAVLMYLAPSFRGAPSAVLPLAGPAAHTSNDETIRFDFLDPSTGWAAAAASISSSRLWIYATTDGARSWHEAGFIDGLGTTYPVDVFKFFDHSRGVIAVGPEGVNAFRTNDGGHTWTRFEVPVNTSALTFADVDHAWATTPYGPVFMRAYATADGGATWRPMPKLPVEGSLIFSSPLDGWLSDVDALGLYVTHDGGSRWESVDLPPPSTAAGSISNIDQPVEILPGGAVVVIDNSVQTEFISLDSGATWRYVTLPPDVTDYSSIAHEDSLHWWAFDGTRLFKTADAGATWALISSQIAYDNLRPTILDAQHAWARVQASDDTSTGQLRGAVWELDTTSDGGLHWTTMTVPVPV